MDVGSPSNFARMMDLFGGDYDSMAKEITGYGFNDSETADVMRQVSAEKNYIMDPHGAIGYLGLKKYKEQGNKGFSGIFLETAHPGKFLEVVEQTLNHKVMLPAALQQFLKGQKQSQQISGDFENFKSTLINL
jgi:threonine synthase